jgi:hypothetical protein
MNIANIKDNIDDDNISLEIDKLLKLYNDNVVVRLQKIDNKSWFVYFALFIIVLVIVNRYKLSLWHFMFLTFILALLIYLKRELDSVSTKEQTNIKLKLIRPQPQNLNDYPDIIEFLFNIRHFYYINPNSFTLMIMHLDNFFKIYEDVMTKQVNNCKYNYDIILYSTRSVLNNLHSVIFNLDVDKNLTKKYQLSLKELHIIIYQYVDKVVKKCKIENVGVQGRNFYVDDFEIY